jgi:hypothetical protein
MNNSFTSPEDQSRKFNEFKQNLKKEIIVNDEVELIQDDFIRRAYPPIDYKPNAQLDSNDKNNLTEIVYSRLTKLFKSEEDAKSAFNYLKSNNILNEFNKYIIDYLDKNKVVELSNLVAYFEKFANEKKAQQGLEEIRQRNVAIDEYTSRNRMANEDQLARDLRTQEKFKGILGDMTKKIEMTNEKNEMDKMAERDFDKNSIDDKNSMVHRILLNYTNINRTNWPELKNKLIEIYGKNHKISTASTRIYEWGLGRNFNKLLDSLNIKYHRSGKHGEVLIDDQENRNPRNLDETLFESVGPGRRELAINKDILSQADVGSGLRHTKNKLRLSDKNELARSRHIKLGSKFISIERLNQKKLALKYPNGKNITHMRVTNISDPMQKLIRELVVSNKFDRGIYNNLSTEDKRIFDNVLIHTNLKDSKDFLKENLHELKPTNQQLKERYDVLLGQIYAGNNNTNILKELKKIALDMYKYQMINEEDFKKILLL